MTIELHEEFQRPQIVRLVVVLASVPHQRVLQHSGVRFYGLPLGVGPRAIMANNFLSGGRRRSHISVQLDNKERKLRPTERIIKKWLIFLPFTRCFVSGDKLWQGGRKTLKCGADFREI